jgi:hypothetical protein
VNGETNMSEPNNEETQAMSEARKKLNCELTLLDVAGERLFIIPQGTHNGIGGVTEKVELIKASSVISQLQTKPYVLRPEGILKLPKHGDVGEIQREAMALEFSRILGLQTTRSKIVNHNNTPALYIPFDEITLLRDVSHGKTFTDPWSSKRYLHYSTLKPVGEGLQSNTIINDLGEGLGLLYLCSDTDAIGGYNQNKALKANRLYVFDQVFSLTDKFKLDSGLTLIPSALTRHTRHDRGRNRTLIEDASIESKYLALMNILKNKHHLLTYCNAQIGFYCQALHRQNNKNTRELLKNAEQVRKKLIERIDAIPKIVPKIPKKLYIKPCFILEKLMNKPILFANDGRPFRYPWTRRNYLRIQAVTPEANNTMLRIQFNATIPADVVSFLNSLGIKSVMDGTYLRIEADDLLTLPENPFFPPPTQDYFSTEKLSLLKNSYADDPQNDKILQLIQHYKQHDKLTQEKKLKLLTQTDAELRIALQKANNKGFAQHLLNDMQFEICKQLMNLTPEISRDQLHEAWQAALKMDQVSQFNKVFMYGVVSNKTHVFREYLDQWVKQTKQITDHPSAVKASHDINILSDRFLKRMAQEEAGTIKQTLVNLTRQNANKPHLN